MNQNIFNMYQHSKLIMMRTYFFLIILLFSVSVVAQTTQEERSVQEKQGKKERSNSNVAPASNNELELDQKEAPKGNSFTSVQSSVISNASLNIQRTFEEIKRMQDQKTPKSKQVQQLNYELIKIKNANQNAFEYYLYNYKIGNYDFDRIEDLKMAAKMQPNHPEVLKSLSAYYYIQDEKASLKQQLSKMHSAKHFSSELSGFASDVLNSMPKNTILITHGEDDTYPLLIEQFINKTRQDVRVVSLDHLQSEEFRKKLQSEGLSIPKGQTINTSFFKEFVKQNQNEVVIATSVPKNYLNTISNNVYIEGLGFGFKINSELSNGKQLAKLYDESIKSSLRNKMNRNYNSLISNYLPFLFEVRNYWIDQENTQKVMEVEADIVEIGKLSNKLEQILKMLR